MFHKEGFKIITIAFLVFAALSIGVHFKIENDWIRKGALFVLFLITGLILQFFRNPKRNFVLNSEQSKYVIGAAPLLPSFRPCQNSDKLFPMGVSAPIPVITTRLGIIATLIIVLVQ